MNNEPARGGGGGAAAAARLRSGRWLVSAAEAIARLRPLSGGGRAVGGGGSGGLARRARGVTMSDASGGGKKPPVEPAQGGPAGRAAGERGLPGSFPLVLKKLMENPPREARLGEGRGQPRGGACFYSWSVVGVARSDGRGLVWAWLGEWAGPRRGGGLGRVVQPSRVGRGLGMDGWME